MKKLILVALAIMFIAASGFGQRSRKNIIYTLPERTTVFGYQVVIGDFVFITADSLLYVTKVGMGPNATGTYMLADPTRYAIVGSGATIASTGVFSGGITAATLNTGQGANELYDMDQNVLTTSAPTFVTVNTGQGANELYDMDQNVMTTSDVVFSTSRTATATITTSLIIDDESITRKDANGITIGNSATVGDTIFAAVGDFTGDILGGGKIYVADSVSLPQAGMIKLGEHEFTRNNASYLSLNNGLVISGYSLHQDEAMFNERIEFDTNFVMISKGATPLYTIPVFLKDTVGIQNKLILHNISDINIQNKAGSGQVEVAERDTSGADAVWVLKNISTVTASGAIAGATVNTGQGAYELYSMNQDVETTDAVTFATVNTGQGANELYDMDQNVLTTSDVTFSSAVAGTFSSTVTVLSPKLKLPATDTTGVGSTAASGTLMYFNAHLYVMINGTWTQLDN